MKILDVLTKETTIFDLKNKDKKGVLEEMGAVVAASVGLNHDEVVRVLIERERLGSTGIGDGVGIPHGKLKSLASLALGFGLSRGGIDFESLDNRPTHIFFLLLTPENSTGLHLQLLARISRMLKNEPFKEKLLNAQSRDELFSIIAEQDEDF